MRCLRHQPWVHMLNPQEKVCHGMVKKSGQCRGGAWRDVLKRCWGNRFAAYGTAVLSTIRILVDPTPKRFSFWQFSTLFFSNFWLPPLPPSLPSILLGSISQQLFPATLKKKKKKYIYLLKIKKRKKEERKKKRGGVPFTILSFFVPLLQSWNNTHPLKTCLNCNAAIGFSF